MAKKNLGQTLLRRKDINLIQLNLALDFKVFYGGKLGTNLLELGVISENTLSEALGESMGVPAAFRKDFDQIPADVVRRVPRETAFRAQAMPFRVANGQLYVAMADPLNPQQVSELRTAMGKQPLLIHVAPELRVQAALEDYYQLKMEPRFKTLATKAFSRSEPPDKVALSAPERPPAPVAAAPDDWVQEDISFAKPADLSGRVTLSVHKISLMLEEAKSRDEIASLALQFAQKFLKRVALFVLRKDIGFGWDGRGPAMSKERVKSIMIPLEEPSIFQTVVQSQGHYLGSVPDTAVNRQFYAALEIPKPKNVMLLPLTIGGITFGVIYGDNGEAAVESDGINELQVMVSRVNIAFERLIISEREKALRQHAAL